MREFEQSSKTFAYASTTHARSLNFHCTRDGRGNEDGYFYLFGLHTVSACACSFAPLSPLWAVTLCAWGRRRRVMPTSVAASRMPLLRSRRAWLPSRLLMTSGLAAT